jgi:hypothetical protein
MAAEVARRGRTRADAEGRLAAVSDLKSALAAYAHEHVAREVSAILPHAPIS